MTVVRDLVGLLKSPLGKKEIPTEYVKDEESLSSEAAGAVESKDKWVKLYRASRVEDADLVMPLLDAFSVVFIDIKTFRNMEDLKRFTDHIKVASKRYNASLLGLDPSWLILLAKDISFEDELVVSP